MKTGALLSLFLFLGALALADEDAPVFPRWKSGEQTGKVTIGEKEEGFVALVPRGFTQKRKWPVVLLAHGNGGTAIGFLKAIKPLAGKRPPLIVSFMPSTSVAWFSPGRSSRTTSSG